MIILKKVKVKVKVKVNMKSLLKLTPLLTLHHGQENGLLCDFFLKGFTPDIKRSQLEI
jgi:hypothetical protein